MDEKTENPMHKLSTKLAWESFGRYSHGNGFVAFDVIKSADRYDPTIMFVHDEEAATDEAAMMRVEQDCRLLARLLNRFRIANEFTALPDYARVVTAPHWPTTGYRELHAHIVDRLIEELRDLRKQDIDGPLTDTVSFLGTTYKITVNEDELEEGE